MRNLLRIITAFLAFQQAVVLAATVPLQATWSMPFYAGMQAPGLAEGVVFSTFGGPVVNESGNVAFVATLSGTGVALNNETAIFAGPPSGVTLIARSGDSTPLGGIFGTFSTMVQLDDANRVFFTSSIEGTGNLSSDGVCWMSEGGVLTKVAREGDLFTPAASNILDGTFFGTFATAPPLTVEANLAFPGGVAGGDASDDVIIGGRYDNLKLVAREGASAPGTDGMFGPSNVTPGATFRLGGINAQGTVAFQSSLSGGTVSPANNAGIWVGPVSDPQLLVRAGDKAAGIRGNYFFHNFIGAPALNGSGQIAFLALLQDITGTVVDGSSSIWTNTSGVLRPVARLHRRAPGTSSGVKYGAFGAPLVTVFGNVCFYAFLEGTRVTADNDFALFSGRRGATRLLAREGSQVPGLPTGVKFGNLNVSDVMLGTNRTVLIAPLTGDTVVNSQNDTGVFVTDNRGKLTLIAREGDTITGTGFSDILTSVSFSGINGYGTSVLRPGGTSDGRIRAMNTLGRLVMVAAFLEYSSCILLADIPLFPNRQPDVHVDDFEATAENAGIRVFTALDDHHNSPVRIYSFDGAIATEPDKDEIITFALENDGTIVEDYVLRIVTFPLNRRGASRNFTYRVYKGATEITEAIKAGTYVEAAVPLDAPPIEYTAVITMGLNAVPVKDSFAFVLEARSKLQGPKRDHAGIAVQIQPPP